MDSQVTIGSEKAEGGCCHCPCKCNSKICDGYIRSVKSMSDESKEEKSYPTPPVALVQIENECAALREIVGSQQETIQDLLVDLEEERNAAASAANEAMSMILRLQRQKAELQMEARQFKQFAEEKMSHDQQELSTLEDLLYMREQAIQALTCEVQAYKRRIISLGLSESEIEGERDASFSRNASMNDGDIQFDFPTYDYPPLKCKRNEANGPDGDDDDDVEDIEKYILGETPRSENHLRNLDHRISEMEKSPKCPINEDFTTQKHLLEKVIIGRSPKHSINFFTDNSGSPLGQAKEISTYFTTDSPGLGSSSGKAKYISQVDNFSNRRNVEEASDIVDDATDRICTIDSIHNEVPYSDMGNKASIEVCENCLTTPRESLRHADAGDLEIKKLYLRLHALEADRESMRQAIISMRTDKAQLFLLREIAQQLCTEMAPEKREPVKKVPVLESLSLMFVFKWITSIILWGKKAGRTKYMFGRSSSNAGLLMLLDKGTRAKPWRCITSSQV